MKRQKTPKEKRIRRSAYEAWASLVAVIQSSYKLAPCLVIVLAAVVLGVVWIALWWTKLMVGFVLLLVLGVALLVYVSTNNYGEAALALVAGLLTAYSVTWTAERFIAFVAVWSAFSFIALMISSVRIAARAESIYRQAALALVGSRADHEEVEARLRTIGDKSNAESLGPIERAETLRLFVFRRMPLEVMPTGLRAVSLLSVITQIDVKTVARFVADLYRIFEPASPEHGQLILDLVYETIRTSAAPPIDFMEAFEDSRRLVLSQSLEPGRYFDELQRALESGVPPSEAGEHLQRVLSCPS